MISILAKSLERDCAKEGKLEGVVESLNRIMDDLEDTHSRHRRSSSRSIDIMGSMESLPNRQSF
jgi:hypothetical protein